MRVNGHELAYYNALLLEGSYASLFSFPSVKEVKTRQWAEFGGLEVNDVVPLLAYRTVMLNMGFDSYEHFIDFITLASRGVEVSQGIFTYQLIYAKSQIVSNLGGLLIVQVHFSDYGLDVFRKSHKAISRNDYYCETYLINGENVNNSFGVNMLKGTSRAVREMGDAIYFIDKKQRLQDDIKLVNPGVFASRDFTFLCSIKGEDMYECVGSYYAFCQSLTKKTVNILQSGDLSCDFMYKSSKLTSVMRDYITFSVTCRLVEYK